MYRALVGVPAFVGSLWVYYAVAIPVLVGAYEGAMWPIVYFLGPIFAFVFTSAVIQKVFKDILIAEESARYNEVRRIYEAG